MEYIDIIVIAVVALAVIAIIKSIESEHSERKMMQFEKIIYNYKGKTQEQIYGILELELRMLDIPGYEIDHFSEPIFKDNLSAIYIVYLKKVKHEHQPANKP